MSRTQFDQYLRGLPAVFTRDQVAQHFGLSLKSASVQLSRWCKRGWLVPVCKRSQMYTRPGWLTEYGNAVEAAQLRYPGIIEAGPGPLIRAGWLKWELSQGRMIAPRSILQGRKIRIANIWVTDRSDRYWRWIRSAAVCLGNTPSLPPLVALVDWLYDDPWDAPSPTDLRIPDEVTADTLFEHLHVASVYRHRLQPMYRSHYAADLYDRTKEMLLAHRQSTGR